MEPVSKYKETDIVGRLVEVFKDQLSESLTEQNELLLNTFQESARKYLEENPPAAFDYVTAGYGIVLKNFDKITFLKQASGPMNDFHRYTGGVSVSTMNQGFFGQDMQDTYYVKV